MIGVVRRERDITSSSAISCLFLISDTCQRHPVRGAAKAIMHHANVNIWSDYTRKVSDPSRDIPLQELLVNKDTYRP